MKHTMKRFLGIAMALIMVMGLMTSAFADTIIDHSQDSSVLTLASAGNTVTYTAVTVEGDPDQTGTGYPDVTTYSYYIELPTGTASTALSAVPVTATYPAGYTLNVDGTAGSSSMTLNFTGGSKVFKIYNGTTLIRTFMVTAGIKGQTLAPVTMRINVQNAVTWQSGHTMNASATAALTFIKQQCGMDATGEMATVTISNLPAGSTAMDAFYYICYGSRGTNVGLMKNGVNISTNGLGLSIKGTGNDGKGQYTYISKIGNSTTNSWLGEFDTQNMSGWLYLNKNSAGKYEMANYGASQYNLVGGDDFVWLFTNNYGDYDIVNK